MTSAVTHLLGQQLGRWALFRAQVLQNMFPNQLPAGGQEQPWHQVAALAPTLLGSPAPPTPAHVSLTQPAGGPRT